MLLREPERLLLGYPIGRLTLGSLIKFTWQAIKSLLALIAGVTIFRSWELKFTDIIKKTLS